MKVLYRIILVERMGELSSIIIDLLKRAYMTVSLHFDEDLVEGISNP